MHPEPNQPDDASSGIDFFDYCSICVLYCRFIERQARSTKESSALTVLVSLFFGVVFFEKDNGVLPIFCAFLIGLSLYNFFVSLKTERLHKFEADLFEGILNAQSPTQRDCLLEQAKAFFNSTNKPN